VIKTLGFYLDFIFGEMMNTLKKNGEFKKDINWDAETIDFEEIPDSKNN